MSLDLERGVSFGPRAAIGADDLHDLIDQTVIKPNVVTNTKLALAPASTLKGNLEDEEGPVGDYSMIEVRNALDLARVDVASAATCEIGEAESGYVRITGTTAITSLGTIAAGIRRIVLFGGALTLTHNGTTLILPGAANITTAAGDTAEFMSEGTSWRTLWYSQNS